MSLSDNPLGGRNEQITISVGEHGSFADKRRAINWAAVVGKVILVVTRSRSRDYEATRGIYRRPSRCPAFHGLSQLPRVWRYRDSDTAGDSGTHQPRVSPGKRECLNFATKFSPFDERIATSVLIPCRFWLSLNMATIILGSQWGRWCPSWGQILQLFPLTQRFAIRG